MARKTGKIILTQSQIKVVGFFIEATTYGTHAYAGKTSERKLYGRNNPEL
jgi:hypothetical protein